MKGFTRNVFIFLSLVALGLSAPRAAETGDPEPDSAHVVNMTILKRGGGRVSWSHSRNRIAFDRIGEDGYYDVFVMRPNGAGTRSLTRGRPDLPQLNNGQPAWHPTGDFIVFQSQDPALETPADWTPEQQRFFTGPGIGINNNLWLMSADEASFWRLTGVADGNGVLHPHFSPDGARLAWAEITGRTEDGRRKWAIRLADFGFAGGAPELLHIETRRPRGLLFYETHGFSPDGGRLLFSGFPENGSYYALEIYSLDLITGRAKRLTKDREWDEHAHFSPDGTEIVWASSRGTPQIKGNPLRFPPRLDYWIMDGDGKNKRRLTRFNQPRSLSFIPGGVACADFGWSPDGASIVAFFNLPRTERRDFIARLRLDRD